MRLEAGPVAIACLVALSASSCAGSVVRPLFGMRDARVTREQATRLSHIVIVPVQLRPALISGAVGGRWEDVALLDDDGLFHALRVVAGRLAAGGLHKVEVGGHGIIMITAPAEPQLMLDRWLKSDDTSVETTPGFSVNALLEIAWAPFPRPIRHVALAARLVDPASGRVVGRALRLILDTSFPPPREQAEAAVESGVRGLGLATRE